MAIRIPQSTLEEAKVLNQAGDIAGAYRVLAEAGDNYAANALVVMEEIDAPESIFAQIVQVHWDRVAPGARQTKFNAVGQLHQRQYLELIGAKPTDIYEGGERFYLLPNSIDIEKSYRKALVLNDLPALATVDSMFSLIDLFLETSNEPFYVYCREKGLKDVTWARLLNPELEESRIEFDSIVFENDPIEPIFETGLTVAALLIKAGEQGKASFALAAVQLFQLFADMLGDAVPQMLGLEDPQARAFTAGLLVTLDNSMTDAKMMRLFDVLTLGDTTGAVGDIRDLSWLTRTLNKALFSEDPGEFMDNESLYVSTTKLLRAIAGNDGLRYQINDITTLSAESLRDASKADSPSGRAYRYALVNLHPFVLTQATTGKPVSDAMTESYDLDAFSEQYLEDRALFLKTLNTFYSTDATVSGHALIEFWDRETGESITQQATSDHKSQRFIFGSGENDTIKGGEDDDHLYGGAGDDKLTGLGGMVNAGISRQADA